MKIILLFTILSILFPTYSFCQDYVTLDLLTLIDPPVLNNNINKGSGKIYLYDPVGNGEIINKTNLNKASKKALANLLILEGYTIVHSKENSDVQILILNLELVIDTKNPGLPKLKEYDGKVYKFDSIDNYNVMVGIRKTKSSDKPCNDGFDCSRVLRDFTGINWNQKSENYAELGRPELSDSTKITNLFTGYKKHLLEYTQTNDFRKMFE